MFDTITNFILNSLAFFQFFTVIDIYERGIVLRFGKWHRNLGVGFHFVMPFYIDQVMSHETVLTTRNMGYQTLTTKDGYTIALSSVVSYKIFSVKTLLTEVEEAETVLEDIITGIITNAIINTNYEKIITDKFNKRLLKEIADKANSFGIDITNFFFVDLAEIKTIRLLTDSNTAVIEEE